MTIFAATIQYVTLDRHNPSATSDSWAADDSHTTVACQIDRTVPAGLNFQDSTVAWSTGLEVSTDGGTTWNSMGGASGFGGAYFDVTSQSWEIFSGATASPLPSGSGRLVRVVVTLTSNLSPADPLGITAAVWTH